MPMRCLNDHLAALHQRAFFRLPSRYGTGSKTSLQPMIREVDFSRALTYPSACFKNKSF